MTLGEPEHRRQGLELYADAQRMGNPGEPHRFKYVGFAFDQVGKIEVAVRVDEHLSDRVGRPVRTEVASQHLFDAAAYHLGRIVLVEVHADALAAGAPWASAGVIHTTAPATGIFAGSSMSWSNMRLRRQAGTRARWGRRCRRFPGKACRPRKAPTSS